MSDRDDPTDRDPAADVPLDETTPPMELIQKSADGDLETLEDRDDGAKASR
jgi:hypothetical protein